MLGNRILSSPPAFVTSLTRVDQKIDTDNKNDYSFAGVNFGAPHPHRKIIACIFYTANQSSAMPFPTSSLIGGASTSTMNGISSWRSSVAVMSTIGIVKLPNATSGVISFTSPDAAREAAIVVYRAVYDYRSDSDHDQSSDFNGSSLDLALNVPPKGALLVAAAGKNVSSINFTNVTKDYEAVSEMRYATAISTDLAEETARAVAATVGGYGASDTSNGVAVSF